MKEGLLAVMHKNIFGKQCGSVYQEGLVDSEDERSFNSSLENCRNVWIDRETKYLPEGRIPFYDYFVTHYSGVIRRFMLKDLRTAVGLGSPPAIYTTNACESLNAVIKRKVNYKESEWPQFNEQMKELVDRQREEALGFVRSTGTWKYLLRNG